jgi:hypothetical protein
MLAAWALALWGTLLVAVAVLAVPAHGVTGALSALLPRAGGGPWAWINLASTVLALVVWIAGAAALVARRR